MAGAGFPMNAQTLAGTTPGTGGLAVLDDASTDAVLTTLGFPASLTLRSNQRVLKPDIFPNNTFTPTAAVAYFLYVGQTMRATVIKKVRILQNTVNGATTSVGEFGVFTTPLAPNGSAGQTLTPTAAFSATIGDLTDATQPSLKGNASDFSTSHAAGLHLWIGVRLNCATAQPTCLGVAGDVGSGNLLITAAAAAFDGATTYAGVLPTLGTGLGALGPMLVGMLD